MKKVLVLLSVTLLLVFGVVQAAGAVGMGWDGGPHKMKGDMNFNPVEKLNLTDQQIVKMKELDQKTYDQTRDLRIKLMDSRHELRQLRLQKNPDQAQIDAKIKEIDSLQEQLRGIMQQSKGQFQSLLTKEQLEQMNQFRGNKCRGIQDAPGAAAQ